MENKMRYFLTTLFLLVFIFTGTKICEAKVLGELPFVLRPEMIQIDGEELFVLENTEITVYSTKTLKILRKFGKNGPGPGEWMTVPGWMHQMQIHNGMVLVTDVKKLLYYSKEQIFWLGTKIPNSWGEQDE
jgi:hypothetical protein